MRLPGQETEHKARGHAEREKRQVNGRRKEAVPARLAQNDECCPKAAQAENCARQQAQAHGEHKIARHKHERAADDEMGEGQVEWRSFAEGGV